MLRLLALAFAFGCGSDPTVTDDEDVPPLDGGFDDGGSEPACEPEVQEPEAPALPRAVEWTCPLGWRAVDGACSPWPESGPLDCPAGEAHFPGGAGCEPIGTDCPLGQFSEPPIEYAAWDRIYLDRSAPPGGDGSSEGSPATSFVNALITALRADAPTVVMISKGEYPVEAFNIGDDMLLWGACTRDTIVKTSTAYEEDFWFAGTSSRASGLGNLTLRTHLRGVLSVPNEGELLLSGLVIEGADTVAAAAAGGASIRADRVVIRNVTPGALMSVGILAEHGVLDLSRVVVEGADVGLLVQPNRAGDPSSARVSDSRFTSGGAIAVMVQEGASLELDRSVVDGNTGTGVRVNGGTLVARDLVVMDTAYLDDLSPGIGLLIAGGSATVQRALLERNRRVGIYLADYDSTLFLDDAIVRDTAAQPIEEEGGEDSSDGGGYGLWVTERTSAVVRRARFERNRVSGLIAIDPLSRLTATDVVVSDTAVGLSVSEGAGLTLRRTATASITRALFERNRGTGIVVINRSVLDSSDVTVRESVNEIANGVGLLLLDDDTRATVNRGRFERNELIGIDAEDRTLLTLNDVAVVETLPNSAGDLGMGLQAGNRARVFGSRVALIGNRTVGLLAAVGANLELSDLIVRGTQMGRAPNGNLAGRGLSLESGTTATITRARIEENLEGGMMVSDRSRVVLRDASVVRTGPLFGVFGRGLQVQQKAILDLANVCIADNHEVGMLASDSDIIGRDVMVLRTKHNQCFDEGLCEPAGGIGVFAGPGARVTLAGFLLADNVETGLTIAGPSGGLPGGEMDLIDGVITGSMLGADVRNTTFDTSRITLRVQLTGNGIDGVEAGSTPLPNTDTTGLY